MPENKTTTAKRKSSTTVKGAEGRQLVIVESPAKARTINKYLGSDYVVMASMGHVRDLPDKNPKGVKDSVPGVEVENDFKPVYQVIRGKGATVARLAKAAAASSSVWLATDLDREGEAIAWHLAEALKLPSGETKRVVFNAITKSEIGKAFKNPRTIDMNKVNAQQARRVLDRIVGYKASPLLWKKVAGGLSAGRVQSVAVRLIVERDREIEGFVPEEYWTITGFFTSDIPAAGNLGVNFRKWLEEAPEKSGNRKNGERSVREKNEWLAGHGCFAADLTEIGGTKFRAGNEEAALAAARLAGFQLGERVSGESPDGRKDAPAAVRLKGRVEGEIAWSIKSVHTKQTKSHPYPPFITSTMQQSAANQLGFTAHATMRLAQDLYEGVTLGDSGSIGLITYMRTDSTNLSKEALGMARDFIHSNFGDKYLPSKANVFSSSNKSAQEAHEAIRPTDIRLTPEQVKPFLSPRHHNLYRLIWERFVACQMSDALWDSTVVQVAADSGAGEMVFRATGRVLVFDGFYKVTGLPTGSDEAVLPKLAEGENVAALHLDPSQHFTQPSPRYTEASLIRKLESEGIGRPSTYAQIIQVIQQRKYVEKIKGKFHSTDLGKVVTDKLIEAFPEIMEVGYTRDMEQRLDDIEEKNLDWVKMVRDFYNPFNSRLQSAYDDIGHAKAETEPAPHACPRCGGPTVYRFGKNGRFLSCAAYPECTYAAPIDRKGDPVEPTMTDIACPKCGKPMVLRKGRFGPFLSCSAYPQCDGILNLDAKGNVSLPKIPPLKTNLPCPKCGAPLVLRRGAKGPWLACSTFPKCRGRLGWVSLDEDLKKNLEKALEEHEKKHPTPVIRNLRGEPVEEGYKPSSS
jgi:DNA topoisomerase I